MTETELKDMYNNITMWTPGREITYKGYTFRKSGNVEENGLTNVEHSEVRVENREGAHVETLTLDSANSFEDLQSSVDKLIEYDPNSLSDWLNR
jgi:hypothetical protein